jgi:hypothetical protein
MITMKKIIVIVLCAILALSLAACGAKSPANSSASQSKEPVQGGDVTVQIPNPFVDCKTLDEAEKIAGFDITLPGRMPEGYSQSAIRAVKNTMIEIIYNNGSDEIRIRKGTGSEDISGDYNEYKEFETATINNLKVTLKEVNGKVNTAVWYGGGYAFAVTANLGETGLDKAVVTDMVSVVK